MMAKRSVAASDSGTCPVRFDGFIVAIAKAECRQRVGVLPTVMVRSAALRERRFCDLSGMRLISSSRNHFRFGERTELVIIAPVAGLIIWKPTTPSAADRRVPESARTLRC